MKKRLTNQEIFAKAIDQNAFNAGILREALTHYINLLENSEPWENAFIDFNTWLTLTKNLKKDIDSYYAENYSINKNLNHDKKSERQH